MKSIVPSIMIAGFIFSGMCTLQKIQGVEQWYSTIAVIFLFLFTAGVFEYIYLRKKSTERIRPLGVVLTIFLILWIIYLAL